MTRFMTASTLRWARRSAAILGVIAGCGPHRAEHDALTLAWTESVRDQPSELDETAVLSREQLIAEVLARNPTLESARQAWREALARYPEAVALDDPRLSLESAPGTIGSSHPYGQVVRLSQRVEWPGKQALRGAVALAEAEATRGDHARLALHLRATASILFDDALTIRRARTLNERHQQLVRALRDSAEASYATGRGSQRDPIRAEIALGLLVREQLDLIARERVIEAQLNGLLHRPATAPLPPLPDEREVATLPDWSAEVWQQHAREHQPRLQAAQSRIDARESDLRLAKKSFLPDVSVSATYNSMWQAPEHRAMVGVALDIPVVLSSRRARVDRAHAAIARATADHAAETSSVDVRLDEALARFGAAVERAELFRAQLLPAARRQLDSAESAYRAGTHDLSEVLTAERQLAAFELDYAQAIGETWQQRAILICSAGAVHEGGAQ